MREVGGQEHTESLVMPVAKPLARRRWSLMIPLMTLMPLLFARFLVK